MTTNQRSSHNSTTQYKLLWKRSKKKRERKLHCFLLALLVVIILILVVLLCLILYKINFFEALLKSDSASISTSSSTLSTFATSPPILDISNTNASHPFPAFTDAPHQFDSTKPLERSETTTPPNATEHSTTTTAKNSEFSNENTVKETYQHEAHEQPHCGTPFYKTNIFEDKNLIPNKKFKRIISGDEAVPHSFPWLVSLHIETDTDEISSQFCAGSLVTPTHVLTAAHCVAEFIPLNRSSFTNDYEHEEHLKRVESKRLILIAGVHDLHDDSRNFLRYRRILKHSEYGSHPCCKNDIAIIELEKPVELSERVSLICLPFWRDKVFVNDVSVSDKVVVAGWGSISSTYDVELAVTLQQTMLSISNDSICHQYGMIFDGTQYCHLDMEKKSSHCIADSGAPLMHFSNNRWYAMGVLSSSIQHRNEENLRRCLTDKASYSVKLFSYVKWINENLKLEPK